MANLTKDMVLVVEMANEEDSRFNWKLQWENLVFLTVSPELHVYNLKMHRKIRNNRNNIEKPKRFHCINKFLASKSSCKIPWLEKYSSKTKKNCTTTDEMKQHFDLAFDITIGKSNF